MHKAEGSEGLWDEAAMHSPAAGRVERTRDTRLFVDTVFRRGLPD